MRNALYLNWKCYVGVAEAARLAIVVQEMALAYPKLPLAVTPPAPAIDAVARAVPQRAFRLGAQNVCPQPQGAYTGESAPAALQELGCTFTLVGHSERRHQFCESDALIAQRLAGALRAGLDVVLCVGETEDERARGATDAVLERQLSTALESVGSEMRSHLIIAYEPVWAIGSGTPASLEEISTSHRFILEWLDKSLIGSLPVLYGGSVKDDNIRGIMALPEVAGVLVGSAGAQERALRALCAAASTPRPDAATA